MKKFALTAIAFALVSGAAMADTGHTNWQGATDKFTGTITNKDQFEDLIKYSTYDVQAKLRKAFADGNLTSEEIKSSGIQDYHFYQGLLGSAKTQAEYDKYLKQMNGGQNVDDNFVSNRDLKAHGSMVMNQVDTKVQHVVAQQAKTDTAQDDRLDKIVNGLKDWTSSLYPTNPSLPEGGQEVPETSRPDQGLERPEAQPPVDDSFGQGHLPDYGNGGDVEPDTDESFGQGHDKPERPLPGGDDSFGQGHLPDFGHDGDVAPDVDEDFGQGHDPKPERPEAQPPVDEDFGQGHHPDFGQDGDVDRPFPGQGDRPFPQPDVDEDFGQGHLPDNGQSNGNSGEVERPRPGNGEGSIERPRPGQGEGSVERPQPGAGEGSVERPRPPSFVGDIGQNKDNIAAMGNAFEQRVEKVNDWLNQTGNAISNNSDRINGLQGAFEQQAAHTGREIARLDSRIDAIEQGQDKLKAGIASATAIATLSQHVGAGNHNIAVAVGGYDGASAVAAGYTYIFDDRRTSFRATISTDSESEIAMGASIGHSW